MSAILYKLANRQRHQCIWCGRETYVPGAGESKARLRHRFGIVAGERGAAKALRRRAASVEHIVPKSLGGRRAGNLAMACQGCNTRRGQDVTWRPLFCIALRLGVTETRKFYAMGSGS